MLKNILVVALFRVHVSLSDEIRRMYISIVFQFPGSAACGHRKFSPRVYHETCASLLVQRVSKPS